ncbi:TnsA-like heteromeric transposase endonuclease subunit [Streptomyces sp. NPDC088726]|uniref:TnsA-like heteromeric transposase endonuclease subunit n=1 Tax=Streptomyces sp. NPDC088726 TaxID=3365874 RepID=UPI0037F11520
MTPTRPRTLRPVRPVRDRTDIRYCDPGGTEHLIPASRAAGVAFEDALPAREIPSYAGQHHTPGHYWSATTDRMVGYESYLESKWMKLLDFNPNVGAFSAQPFTIDAQDTAGEWQHTPDLFVRRRDGTVLLLDVKNDARMQVPPSSTRPSGPPSCASRSAGTTPWSANPTHCGGPPWPGSPDTADPCEPAPT